MYQSKRRFWKRWLHLRMCTRSNQPVAHRTPDLQGRKSIRVQNPLLWSLSHFRPCRNYPCTKCQGGTNNSQFISPMWKYETLLAVNYSGCVTHKPAGEWKRMFIFDDTLGVLSPVVAILNAVSDIEEHLEENLMSKHRTSMISKLAYISMRNAEHPPWTFAPPFNISNIHIEIRPP